MHHFQMTPRQVSQLIKKLNLSISLAYAPNRIKVKGQHPVIVMLLLSLMLGACGNFGFKPGGQFTSNTNTDASIEAGSLNIWWDKGYYPEEDEAIQKVVEQWQQKSGVKVKLTFYSQDNIVQQVQRAINNNNPPDVLFAYFTDLALSPRLAWEGKLVDVSDVIAPVKDKYIPTALETALMFNKTTAKRSYYAVPIKQQALHISYWRDLLKQAGYSEQQIPKDWVGFWDFWKQVQDNLRKKGQQNIYGLGLPMSGGASSDTYYVFEQTLEAYDVRLLDENGQLLLDKPQVRQGIIKALTWYTSFYKDKYVPTAALNWSNPDNNVDFLNHTTVMTSNPSLSIPASQRQDKDLYLNKIATIEYPKNVNGKPIKYLVSVKQAIILTSSQRQKEAKDFLSYLIQPENLGLHVKGSLGRWFPVMQPLFQDPYWTDPADPHISVAVKQFTKFPTRPFYSVLNPAYTQVQQENVWGKAINSIVKDNLPPEQAADRAIARIKQIFAEWN